MAILQLVGKTVFLSVLFHHAQCEKNKKLPKLRLSQVWNLPFWTSVISSGDNVGGILCLGYTVRND